MVRGGFRLLCGLMIGLLLAGCNSNQGQLAPEDAEQEVKRNSLVEVSELLRLYSANHNNKAPAKSTDLSTYEVGFPTGYERVKGGDVVVIWSTPFAEGASDKILAYEKAVPESGGYVLMQDGTTVKKLTADEFKSAPKAGK
ncbi:hypothetical protein V5E97_16680 [Singulisphaera sp. Ch08]|uniref:Lipoprotein n=1 Tax=Singulisphaera sp. Ch08 TaxID=3120278 RepID=A0AAU7CQJ0_9BACT